MAVPLSSAFTAVMATDHRRHPLRRRLAVGAVRHRYFALGPAIVLRSRCSGSPRGVRGNLAVPLHQEARGPQAPVPLETHCWSSLLPPDQFSFPSGHSITAFAVAVSLGSFYPTLIEGLLFCAVSVAISRILLGMHFLSDVLAGCAIGAGLGFLSVCLVG